MYPVVAWVIGGGVPEHQGGHEVILGHVGGGHLAGEAVLAKHVLQRAATRMRFLVLQNIRGTYASIVFYI
jgi:hypothetical protein